MNNLKTPSNNIGYVKLMSKVIQCFSRSSMTTVFYFSQNESVSSKMDVGTAAFAGRLIKCPSAFSVMWDRQQRSLEVIICHQWSQYAISQRKQFLPKQNYTMKYKNGFINSQVVRQDKIQFKLLSLKVELICGPYPLHWKQSSKCSLMKYNS